MQAAGPLGDLKFISNSISKKFVRGGARKLRSDFEIQDTGIFQKTIFWTQNQVKFKILKSNFCTKKKTFTIFALCT